MAWRKAIMLHRNPSSWTGQGAKPLKILKVLMTSACLLSAIVVLTGCGHLINRLI